MTPQTVTNANPVIILVVLHASLAFQEYRAVLTAKTIPNASGVPLVSISMTQPSNANYVQLLMVAWPAPILSLV